MRAEGQERECVCALQHVVRQRGRHVCGGLSLRARPCDESRSPGLALRVNGLGEVWGQGYALGLGGREDERDAVQAQAGEIQRMYRQGMEATLDPSTHLQRVQELLQQQVPRLSFCPFPPLPPPSLFFCVALLFWAALPILSCPLSAEGETEAMVLEVEVPAEDDVSALHVR